MELKKFTRLSLLLSLSIVLSLLESLFPIFNGIIPGLKLGLANIVILFILYEYSFKDALYVSILRIILVGIIRTGLFNITFFFSLSGALFSVIIMYIAKRFTKLSIIGISILGSVFHSLGQILISIVLIKTSSMLYYLPLLLIFSIPTGLFTGILCKQTLESYRKITNT